MKSNVLLQGREGTGKTRSIITQLAEYVDESGTVKKGAGLISTVISLSPGLHGPLGSNICTEKTSHLGDKVHWHYIPNATSSWKDAKAWALLAQTVSINDLTQKQDPKRLNLTQMMDLYNLADNYVCQGCGVELGPMDDWDTSYCCTLDDLTGLTDICRSQICGSSPFLSLPKIGGIQGLIWDWLKQFWGRLTCNTVVMAHIEREIDPLTGMSSIRTSTIGQALTPRIIKLADEVVLARYERGRYLWDTSTDDEQLQTKVRRLPRSPNLTPDFTQLFKS